MPTVLPSPPRSLLRALALRSVSRVLGTQRRLAELQLACARLAERQVTAGFERHRVGLEAGIRFTEVTTDTLAKVLGVEAPAAPPSVGAPT